MTTSGTSRFKKEDIGAELLPILTEGLYREPLDALREYVQNGIDAGAKKIAIRVSPSVVAISDDGDGMDEQTAKRSIRLGKSDKNPVTDVGFRGIGIYSAFNLCNRLEITTRHSSEDHGWRILFDFGTMRNQLLEDQLKKKSTDLTADLFLESLLSSTVTVSPLPSDEYLETGTTVTLTNIHPDLDGRLKKSDDVESYLRDTVPLPFDPEFKLGTEIQAEFDKFSITSIEMTLDFNGEIKQLHRPYTNELFTKGEGIGPKFYKMSVGKKTFGWAWVILNDVQRQLPTESSRGLLIKKKGFSIGTRNFTTEFFPRPVFAKRITGEIIILHDDLLPNAARSDFEHSAARQEFITTLNQLYLKVRDWASDVQKEERALTVLDTILGELVDISGGISTARGDATDLTKLTIKVGDAQRRLRVQAPTLRKIRRDLYDDLVHQLDDIKKFITGLMAGRARTMRERETEVARTVQSQVRAAQQAPSPQNAMQPPPDLLDFLDKAGVEADSDIRKILAHIDDSILKPQLSADEYKSLLAELLDILEL